MTTSFYEFEIQLNSREGVLRDPGLGTARIKKPLIKGQRQGRNLDDGPSAMVYNGEMSHIHYTT